MLSESTSAATADDARLTIRTPIDVRSTSLAVVALIAVIGFLLLARAVFIPITIAVLTSYALTPVINSLERFARLPKALGAALTLVLLVGATGYGLASLQPQAMHMLELVPRATAKFSGAMRHTALEPPGAVAKMEEAAAGLERAAATATGTESAVPVSSNGVHMRSASSPPAAAAPSINVREYLVMGTANALSGAGQLVVIVALVYFLLISGDSFRRTLVRISGDTLSKKKITVQILDQIDSQIQRYMLVQVLASALLGLATWGEFAALGLQDSLLWGMIGAVLYLIPYVGPTAFVFIVGVVAYVQFDTVQPVVILIGSTLAIVGVIGMLLVPYLMQRVGGLNVVTVFVSLLFWGWLWGIWGLLLGVPIVMALHAVCERVEDLQPIGALLGHERAARPAASANQASG
jgi:predicted PurR-regulated permease PerM